MNTNKSKGILVPTFGSITLINPERITYLEAMQNYCRLYKDDSTFILTSMSFGKTLEMLLEHNFFHCHKSYALKLDKVIRYRINGEAELVGNIIVPIARRRKKAFLEAFRS